MHSSHPPNPIPMSTTEKDGWQKSCHCTYSNSPSMHPARYISCSVKSFDSARVENISGASTMAAFFSSLSFVSCKANIAIATVSHDETSSIPASSYASGIYLLSEREPELAGPTYIYRVCSKYIVHIQSVKGFDRRSSMHFI